MSDYKGGGPDGRKPVAVVHADMVGYSRLIALDHTGTLARLRVLRATLLDPTIARFGGRVVQTAGDSRPMLFDSVTDAVNCAVVLQQALPDHDPVHSADCAIIFRMGVDLGDVIADGTDFHDRRDRRRPAAGGLSPWACLRVANGPRSRGRPA